MSPITIEALLIIDAIERRGSFAKAAEELNKATSALSYSVQKLEEQLDVALFQRQGRRSVLTPAGRLVLEEGRKILDASRTLADKAREVATGWEPRLRIALESTLDTPCFFSLFREFLDAHPNLEVDISESVLNGGWEALEQDRVDLVVGIPGPVPQQKGYRAVSLGHFDLALVIAAGHPALPAIRNGGGIEDLRRVVTHDTSTVDVVRSEGLINSKRALYLQNIDQKIQAQLAGLGVGHLPRKRIQHYLDQGQLIDITERTNRPEMFMAWKISNKGKALRVLTDKMASMDWQ